ncbi:hypothetical protein Syun_011145 [Stephania yunnanensis]|uniref:Uncharacterized protein n=1 Tax=Stephania yunnanensis TaxID=152371 RepID=A0AAP0PHX4_9MAGN
MAISQALRFTLVNHLNVPGSRTNRSTKIGFFGSLDFLLCDRVVWIRFQSSLMVVILVQNCEIESDFDRAFDFLSQFYFLIFVSFLFCKLWWSRSSLQLRRLRLIISRDSFSVLWCHNKKRGSLEVVRSALDNGKLRIDNNDNGGSESVRVLLERLFVETQKLEEQIYGSSSSPEGTRKGFSLEMLGSDLQAALAALRKKEQDLKDAESLVFSESAELERAKRDLKRQEEEIAAAHFKQEKIENDLKGANQELASRARVVEDLKLEVEAKDRELVAAKSALTLKEEQLDKMKNDLMMKTVEVAKMDHDIKSKDNLLNEANEVIRKQAAEVQELQKTVAEKEQELEELAMLRELDKEKLAVAETSLQEQTFVWLSAQEELKRVTEEAHKHMSRTNETLEEFRQVKKLLSDLRSELVSSQKSLASSRGKMEEQEGQLERQVAELEEQKGFLISYMRSLEEAKVEVEKERLDLKVAMARSKELEEELFHYKLLIEELQEQLREEKSSLDRAMEEIASLQKALNQKNSEFGDAQSLLQEKEAELVEARLQIQHLKSEQATIRLTLDEKDSDLLSAQNKLKELSEEVAQLNELLSSSKEQLIRVTGDLKEKQELVCTIQKELDDTRIKHSEATDIVVRITDLTNKLVGPVLDDYSDISGFELDHTIRQQSEDRQASIFWRPDEEMELELEMTRADLRAKEMEVLAAKRALTVKDEEIKTVLDRLEKKEMELSQVKQEMLDDAKGLKKLYQLAQERIGEKTIGDLAIEKLRLEVAQLDVEAATGALRNLANMSSQLLKATGDNVDFGINEFNPPNVYHGSRKDSDEEQDSLMVAQREFACLSALTEELVKEAGIVAVVDK